MSHIVTVAAQVKAPLAVAAACRRLGLAEPVHGSAELHSGAATGLLLHLAGWRYPAVLDTASSTIHFASDRKPARNEPARPDPGEHLLARRGAVDAAGGTAARRQRRRPDPLGAAGANHGPARRPDSPVPGADRPAGHGG